ncbi:MAG: hypothetical protein C4562_02395 [Actinobacteria bacterium]|nr:MAG: hypothetical protein C4562_02395 [Actinomycetota bacterium]
MRKYLIIGLIVIQAITLVAFFGYQEYKIRTAEYTVKLKTVPVDPVDMMRGHYAVVQYEISTLSEEKYNFWNDVTRGSKLKKGDCVYVELIKKGNLAKAAYFTKKLPIGKLVIKGEIAKVEKKHISDIDPETKEDYGYNQLIYSIKYDIEKIFISEAKAKQVEWANKPYLVTVKVNSGGEAKAMAIEEIK